MSENMVERVARAICQTTGFYPDPSKAWRQYEEAARAAIEAMREPPSAVWIAMMNTLDDGNGDLHYRKWQAAIDAALKP